MSSIVIAGDTSGSVTLQAPAVSGSTTLTLPATSGTVLTTASGTAATATNLAGGSNGTIPYQSASGTTQMLAVGTAGQVLQTNGAGAPTWVTAGGGDLVLITTASFSGVANTSTTFDGVFTSTYKSYRVVVRQISGASNAVPALNLRVSGSTNTAANYNYSFVKLIQNGTAPTNDPSANGQTNWPMPPLWVSTSTSCYWMDFTGVGVSSPEILVAFSGMSNAQSAWFVGGLRWEGSAITPDGFILTANTGTMTGTIDVYGYK